MAQGFAVFCLLSNFFHLIQYSFIKLIEIGENFHSYIFYLKLFVYTVFKCSDENITILQLLWYSCW